jgi:hypothetical protein
MKPEMEGQALAATARRVGSSVRSRWASGARRPGTHATTAQHTDRQGS